MRSGIGGAGWGIGVLLGEGAGPISDMGKEEGD